MKLVKSSSYGLVALSYLCCAFGSVAGTLTQIQNFTDLKTTGCNPTGLVDINDTLFASYRYGGTQGDGTIVGIPLSTEVAAVVYNFTDHQDGANPLGLVAVDNHAYGVTYSGGIGTKGKGSGTIFKTYPDYKSVARSVSFPPKSPLSQGGTPVYVNGALYGNSRSGSSQVLYRLDLTSNALTTSAFPMDSTVSTGTVYGKLVSLGNLIYGITNIHGDISLYRYDTTTGQFTVLNNFSQPTESAVQLEATDGQNTLYGYRENSRNGQVEEQVVSVNATTGAVTPIHQFNDFRFGKELAWTPGLLYGTSEFFGEFFQIDLTTNEETQLAKFGNGVPVVNLIYKNKELFFTVDGCGNSSREGTEEIYRYTP